jgi:large subunit ribosomal protein L30
MGRNPVVGRQGPEYHAAVIPGEAAAAMLAVKQIRSEIGHPETMRRTLRALGLRHHQQVVQVKNTASARGMLYKVRHLVDVTAVRGATHG